MKQPSPDDMPDNDGTIRPDPEDFALIVAQHGALPLDADDAVLAHHYRLAVAAKLIRLSGGKPEPEPAS
jgi:hypothetical protein